MPVEYALLDLKPQFQDWLVDAGVMIRRPRLAGDCILPLKSGAKLYPYEKRIQNVLVDSYGYVLTKDQIMDAYEERGGVDLPEDLLKHGIYSIRNKIEDPSLILNAHGIGYGVGIDRFRLVKTRALVLERFFAQFGKWIPSQSMAKFLWDGNLEPLINLRQEISKLNLRSLNGTPVVIESSGRGRSLNPKAYRLKYRDGGLKLLNQPAILSEHQANIQLAISL